MHGTIAPSATLDVTVTAGGCPIIDVTGHMADGIGGMANGLGGVVEWPLEASQLESKKPPIAE